MVRDLTPRSALRVVSLAVALLAFAVAPLSGQPPIFTKTLKKVNGVTVTIPPASLSNGDLLDWEITYQFGQPAQVNIEDLLPPTLQYVGGSLQVASTWTKQWFNGTSWVSVDPGSATGVGAVVNPVPVGTGATFLLPAPPSAPVNTTGSGGDGYRAIPYKDNVQSTDNLYILNHHALGTYLDCFVVATGARCVGYPVHPTVTNGASYSANGDNTTPGQPIEYLDRVNGRLYFPVIKNSSSELGILCADLRLNKSCGFYSLSTLGTNLRSIQGIGAVGTKLYAQLPNGKIGCLDTGPAIPILCAGQPYPAVTTSFDPYWDSSEIIGTRIYSAWQTYDNPTNSTTLNTTVPYILGCFDTTSNAPCAGWGPKTPDPTGIIGILYPLLDAFGTVGGVCVHTTNPPSTVPPSGTQLSSAFKCYDLSTGNLLTSPANYKTWAQTFAGGWYQAAGYGQSGYYKARVFNGNYGTFAAGQGAIGCYDFAASIPGPCVEPLWPLKGPGVTDKHYATIADPERPGCMWYYGDDGKLGSFEAADGSACGATTLLDAIVTPADSYCAGGAVSGWDKLSVAGLALGGGVTATLTIYDGNNPTVLAKAASGIPYAQNLAVTSLPVILGSSGLNIGYGNLLGLGQYKSLRIVLQFNGVTNHTPWTQTPPPSAEVTWFGDPPQFCFQTKVATCEGLLVTNQASAVTTPVVGAPFNNVAPSPAFSATHVLGADCTGGLTIHKAVLGAPSGFTGTFLFNVTCSTPNGPLQQQLSLTWPSTTVTMTGIPFGSTCLVSEDSALPPLPAGDSWSGVPASIPASGVVVIISGGKNQISFANQIRACDDRGHVKITKKLLDVPSGFSGTFNFNLSCLSGTTLITQQAQITLPGSSSVTLNGIPSGSSCLVTEAPPLPPLPAGWFWLAPSYLPASGQVVLAGTCCPEVEVTDRAKFCCTDAGGAVPHKPDTQP
jgi:hypothetical protein